MSHRDEIGDLAKAIGEGLTAYIAVHNAIFRDAATFTSLLKNLLGRGVPMSQLLQHAQSLLPFWQTMQERMNTFRRSSYQSCSLDEQRYFDLLAHYVDALDRTVAVLVDRQRLLNEGSKGGANNPMTWAAHQQKERAYEAAVKEYRAIGAKLNDAAPIIFA